MRQDANPVTTARDEDAAARPTEAALRREPTLWERLAGIPTRAPEGWTRRGPTAGERRIDLALGIALGALMALSNWAGEMAGMYSGWLSATPLWAAIAFPAAYCAAIAVRRSHPMLALCLGTLAFLAGFLVPYREISFTQFAYFALLYSAGAWSRDRVAVAWLRLVITVATIAWVMYGALATMAAPSGEADAAAADGGGGYALFAFLVNVAYYLGAYVLGNLDYLRAGHTALADEQARIVAAQREQLADQAVRLDRLRIARELHDAVAHHVSLMGLQAAVARRSLPESEGSARAAGQLEQVESSAREALEELQGILSTLRASDEPGDDAPSADGALGPETRAGEASTQSPSTRGVEQLPELVEQVRAAGGRVELAVVGEPGRLTPSAGLAAYRIVQEALTNVRKHAGAAAEAEVRLRWGAEALEVDVTDDGVGAPSRLPGGGRGLAGMRERAAAVGGELEAGPRAGRGFRVRLRVPVAGVR